MVQQCLLDGALKRRNYDVFDLYEHLAITSASGTGKSKGPVAHLINKTLQLRGTFFGASVKFSDPDVYTGLAQSTGAPYVRFGPNQNYAFPFLEYLRELGVYSADIASVIEAMADTNATKSQTEEADWVNARRLLLTSTLDLLHIAGEDLSAENIDRFVSSVEGLLNDTDIDGDEDENEDVDDTEDEDTEEEKTYAANICEKVLDLGTAEGERIVRNITDKYLTYHSKIRSSIRFVLDALLAEIQREPLGQLLQASDSKQEIVTPDHLLKKGVSIILDLPIEVNTTTGRYLLALWVTCIRIAMQKRDLTANLYPVGIFIDEIQSTRCHAGLTYIQSLGREFRVFVVFATQNLTKLIEAVGEPAAKALFAGANTHLIGPSGDELTRRYYQEKAGKHWIKQVTKSFSFFKSSYQLSVTEVERPRLTEQDLQRLRKMTPEHPYLEMYLLVLNEFYLLAFSPKGVRTSINKRVAAHVRQQKTRLTPVVLALVVLALVGAGLIFETGGIPSMAWPAFPEFTAPPKKDTDLKQSPKKDTDLKVILERFQTAK